MTPNHREGEVERRTDLVAAIATLTERVDNVKTTVSDAIKGLHHRITALDLKNDEDHAAVGKKISALEERIREQEMKMVRVMVYVSLASITVGAIIHAVIALLLK